MKVKELSWKVTPKCEDVLFTARVEQGRFTVLNRLTGWGDGNIRDVETGFMDTEGKFWLASGMVDIREHAELGIDEAIAFVKQEANICIGGD